MAQIEWTTETIVATSVIAVLGAMAVVMYVLWRRQRAQAHNAQKEADKAEELRLLESRNHQSQLVEKEEKIEQLQDDNTLLSRAAEQLKEQIAKQRQQMEQWESETNSKMEELRQQLAESNAMGRIANPELETLLQETEKQNKAIKSLKEELEDAQDELEELNKKNKKSSTELNALKDKLSVTEAERTKALQEVSTLQEQLRQQADTLRVKMESLSFVQGILSAPESHDEQTAARYRRIEALQNLVEGDLKEAVKKTIGKLDDETERLMGSELTKWVVTQKKSWLAGKTAVAFVGQFSAGKTSIVNRILSQDDPTVPRLPVRTGATTAIATYITGGPETEYRYFSHDNRLRALNAEVFNKVTKELLDHVGSVRNLIKYFVLTYNNHYLENLSILDTPGFDSGDKEDHNRTLEVINECDALFWVIDVQSGTINRSSIELIKEHLCKPLYIVINKIDTLASVEADKVEQQIRESFEREGIAVEGYIRFCADEQIAPLSDIMEPIQSITRSEETSDYLRRLQRRMKDYLEDLESEQTEKYAAYQHATNDYNDAQEEFNKTYSTMAGNCEWAANIINASWTTHFRIAGVIGPSDKYELSKYNGEVLKDLIINRIVSENMKQIKENYEETTNATKQMQRTFTDLIESQKRTGIIRKALNDLQKQINLLKE